MVAGCDQNPFLPYVAVALPALGRPEPSLELPEISVSGNGDTPPELLRPPALGRPIRLLDSADKPAAGALEAVRIVIFECIEGSFCRPFRPSLFRSSRDEYETGRSRE